MRFFGNHLFGDPHKLAIFFTYYALISIYYINLEFGIPHQGVTVIWLLTCTRCHISFDTLNDNHHGHRILDNKISAQSTELRRKNSSFLAFLIPPKKSVFQLNFLTGQSFKSACLCLKNLLLVVFDST